MDRSLESFSTLRPSGPETSPASVSGPAKQPSAASLLEGHECASNLGANYANDELGVTILSGPPIEESRNTSAEYEPVATCIDDVILHGPQRRRRPFQMSSLLVDFFCVVAPLAMVGFVVTVWKLDGSHVIGNSFGPLQNAITILATVFPIVFAAIVGQLMSEAARWLLERGCTIGCLEQLLGSKTVGGTAATAIKFRSLNTIAVALVLVWLFSPLGTQSLLRMSMVNPGIDETPANSTYFDTNARSLYIEWIQTASYSSASNGVMQGRLRSLALLYTTLVMAPNKIKTGTMDIWGNVKVPFLSNLGSGDWHNISLTSGSDSYSSLMGIPVRSIEVGEDIFSIESTYLRLECGNISNDYSKGSNPVPMSYEGLRDAASVNNEDSDGPFSLPNGTWHGYDTGPYNGSLSDSTWTLALDRFVDPIWIGYGRTRSSPVYEILGSRAEVMHTPSTFLNETGVEARPTNLLIQGFPNAGNGPAGALRAICGVKQVYVESQVQCSYVASERTCRVIAQRASRKLHSSENISYLSFPRVFNLISYQMPRTTGTTDTFQSESSLYYLVDPSLKNMQSQDQWFLRNVTEENLSIRLSQLINTYYQLSQLHMNATAGTDDNIVFQPSITVATRHKKEIRVFRVTNIWVLLCFASSLVLLGAGVLSVILKHWAQGPEVLGYVSTVLRDSKHMEVDSDSGWLDGDQLSRTMKYEKIRLGYVKSKGSTGRVLGVASIIETRKI